MRPIYLDYAASTPADKAVLNAALPYYSNVFYNPASTHILGQKAEAAVRNAREKCAAAIGANAEEIYFTSGGTEAINWAMRSLPLGKRHVVVSALEHDAVISCARVLEKSGYEISYVRPNRMGTVTPEALNAVMRDDTALVCVMTVNNIVGGIQPIKALCETAHKFGALFFTDAVQAVNSLDLDVRKSGVDMLAVSGHKFYAPKGVGFLYVKRGVALDAFIVGGGQERGMRAGTVDVPAVVAMGEAAERAVALRESYLEHSKAVADAFLKTLRFCEPIICADKTDDISCIMFRNNKQYVNGGRLAVALSLAGVCCSVGSACSAGSATPPRTLIEMDVPHPESAVRFSFGRPTSVTAAKNAARIVNATVERLTK